jgi:hypothetical protein
VSAALFILYQGFKNNFLGIGEAIKGVGGFIKEFFDLLLGEYGKRLPRSFSILRFKSVLSVAHSVGSVIF